MHLPWGAYAPALLPVALGDGGYPARMGVEDEAGSQWNNTLEVSSAVHPSRVLR